MGSRYQVSQGIVIRRTQLPSGDVVATLLREHGKWRGIARKGKRVGGNLGKLSLFHDVNVQYYRRRDEDLAVFTQVTLNGALPRLSDPAIYPYAHVLAELTDKLTVDVHVGENVHAYLVSGLRGLSQHPDPEAVALVMSWRLLQQAGLGPRLSRCVRCAQASPGSHFDIAAGGLSCGDCQSGVRLSAEALRELTVILRRPVREALGELLSERPLHWRLLRRYTAYHVGELNSLDDLRRHLLITP